MDTLFGFLQKAQTLEEVVSSVYRAAAQRFACDVYWNGLFLRLAGEETQHGLRIQMVSARLARDRAALREAKLAEADIDALVKEGRALLERIGSPGDLSLPELVDVMRALERRLATIHAHAIVTTSDSDFTQFFADLAAQDRAHAEMLDVHPGPQPA